MGTRYASQADLTGVGTTPLALQGIASGDLDKALDNASAIVDSYIGARFELPLPSFGKDIVQATVNLAVWELISARGFQPGADDPFEKKYERSIAWLRDVARGLAKPQFPDTKTKSGFDPQGPDFALQTRVGGIGLATSDTDGMTIGSLTNAPKGRGW